MRIIKVNNNDAIWANFGKLGHIVVVTTNQSFDLKGNLVMGAGIALEAKKRIPDLPALMSYECVGYKVPYYYTVLGDRGIGCLQTKFNWKHWSPIGLVANSIEAFYEHTRKFPDIIFHCPLVATGYGGLNWELDVLPLVAKLPDNVIFYDNRG